MKELKKDYDFTRDQYESEVNAKSEMQKALSKSNTELNGWRQKYEEEAVVKNGQLEETNKGLVSELNTLGDEMLAAKSKILQLERVKVRYENDITDMTSDLETIQRKAATLDKKQRTHDIIVKETKQKEAEAMEAWEKVSVENHDLSKELKRLKRDLDDTCATLDEQKRQNKSMGDENQNLIKQFSDSLKSVEHAEKEKRNACQERDELAQCLEETEQMVENTEQALSKLNNEMLDMKTSFSRQLKEKTEEHETYRLNMQKTIEAIQADLDNELTLRQQAVRAKSKLEADLADIEVQLGHANHQAEQAIRLQRELKGQNNRFAEKLEDAAKSEKSMLKDQGAIERRANLMQAELEAANDRTNELMMEINEHNKEKRQLEMEVNSANAAVEEAINSARSADIAGKKAAADAAKMAEQLNREVSRVSSLEAKKKKLEGQLVTMEIKIRELESGSLKGGKKYVMKLEMDQRELESELQNMMKLHAEGVKQVKKMERIVRESDQRAKDAKVDSGRIMELMETLEAKLKKEKSCSDEVHEHLQIHMSKARKLQLQLDDAEERAEMAEANYLKMKDVLVAEKEKRN